MDNQTKEYLQKMGPTYHMSLLHHHNITAKLNNVELPSDETLITFENADGSQYNITFANLKKFAQEEQENFLKQNGN